VIITHTRVVGVFLRKNRIFHFINIRLPHKIDCNKFPNNARIQTHYIQSELISRSQSSDNEINLLVDFYK
jgi:hypothetical protein